MAGYNELLVGRYNRALQKLFGLKGSKSLESLNPELQATISLVYGAETRYLEGWERFGAFVNQAAGGAGTNAAVRMRNPAGSNVIAVFEKIMAVNINSLADSPSLQTGGGSVLGDLLTIVALTGNRFPDNRQRPQPTIVASTNAAAGITTGFSMARGSFPINGQVDFIVTDTQEIQVLPGEILQIIAGTQTQSIGTSWWWRERFLEESERT
jgi:hypothetical protein